MVRVHPRFITLHRINECIGVSAFHGDCISMRRNILNNFIFIVSVSVGEVAALYIHHDGLLVATDRVHPKVHTLFTVVACSIYIILLHSYHSYDESMT